MSKHLLKQHLHTSRFPTTLEIATRMANQWTKGICSLNGEQAWKPCYNTAIKADIATLTESDIKAGCLWVVTNKFDTSFSKGITNGI